MHEEVSVAPLAPIAATRNPHDLVFQRQLAQNLPNLLSGHSGSELIETVNDLSDFWLRNIGMCHHPLGHASRTSQRNSEKNESQCFHAVVGRQRPKLSDPTRERRGLQPKRDGRVRCSAWLA